MLWHARAAQRFSPVRLTTNPIIHSPISANRIRANPTEPSQLRRPSQRGSTGCQPDPAQRSVRGLARRINRTPSEPLGSDSNPSPAESEASPPYKFPDEIPHRGVIRHRSNSNPCAQRSDGPVGLSRGVQEGGAPDKSIAPVYRAIKHVTSQSDEIFTTRVTILLFQ